MANPTLHLTEREQTALESIAQRTGKTPEELMHDAVKDLLDQFQSLQREDRLPLLKQARGMWKDRTELASWSNPRCARDRFLDPCDGEAGA